MKIRYLFFVLLSGLSVTTVAQEEEDWKLYTPSKSSEDSTENDSIDVITTDFPDFIARSDSADFFCPSGFLNFDTNKVGKINVSKDSRIDQVLSYLGSPNPPNPVLIDGYRVQVFFDQDRDKVLAEKSRFLATHYDMEAYMEWQAPYHYLRVGNFHTEQRARKIAEELKPSFPSATIYRSKIHLPNLDY